MTSGPSLTHIPNIVGHAAKRENLKQLVQRGNLPSTLMFVGASGIGKRLVALELCRSMFCESGSTNYGGCGACKACHLFETGNTADFYLIQCLDRESVSVDSLRDLLYNLSLKAFSGKYRVVLFDNAEYLSLQASNLLLKSLEEPRPDTYFILVTASPSRMPATLLSRCQVWYFDSLSAEEVQRVLQQRILANPDSLLSKINGKELADLSCGSLDGIESIAANYELWLEVKEKLEKVAGGDGSLAIAFAAKLAKEKDNLRVVLQLMRIFARGKIREGGDELRARWAVFLQNIIAAERFIFDRNLAAASVLSFCLVNLLGRSDLRLFTTLTNSVSLLERVSV